MTLSDAIRLGSMACDQSIGPKDKVGGRCALLAAALAIGGEDLGEIRSYRLLLRTFPILETIVTLPDAAGHPHTTELMTAIWLLNDDLRWSREAIAEFVEAVEMRQVPAAVEAL